tara:strand:+ start:281 stop:541 length:261 start_codon:yes stop_codon:yes gene_type:complete
MPKYFYICSSCSTVSSFYHSMSEEMSDCPACKKEGSLRKKPSSFFFSSEEEGPAKVGQVVKESIEEFKQELESQKNELKEEYNESS